MCKNNCNCISDILKVIYLLQKNAECSDDIIESCDKPSLGQFVTSFYNTRPVMLYTCNSNGVTPWSAPTTRVVDPAATSSVFRIEKIDNCCATFRVLIANDDGTYSSTESFFTMNLECICCLRCLGDTYIENV
ncbi:MAG: hypothetical protein J6O62_02615 [Bacilli bacterium]|nr:hypothetical protein [Bacilli bacterium]MBO6195557.1 hypothetical protein [Bacilli bacterium]